MLRWDRIDRGRRVCEGERYVVVLVWVTCELLVLIVYIA